jgi:hypothetical protein
MDLSHRVYVVDGYELCRITEGSPLDGKVLRRIVRVYVVTNTHPPLRRAYLNCGHEVDVPRGLRPTVGKLTGCPECK